MAAVHPDVLISGCATERRVYTSGLLYILAMWPGPSRRCGGGGPRRGCAPLRRRLRSHRLGHRPALPMGCARRKRALTAAGFPWGSSPYGVSDSSSRHWSRLVAFRASLGAGSGPSSRSSRRTVQPACHTPADSQESEAGGPSVASASSGPGRRAVCSRRAAPGAPSSSGPLDRPLATLPTSAGTLACWASPSSGTHTAQQTTCYPCAEVNRTPEGSEPSPSTPLRKPPPTRPHAAGHPPSASARRRRPGRPAA